MLFVTFRSFYTADGTFEGDIHVTPEQIDHLQKGINQRGSIIGKRWNPARIPYAVESSMGKLICYFVLEPSYYVILSKYNILLRTKFF